MKWTNRLEKQINSAKNDAKIMGIIGARYIKFASKVKGKKIQCIPNKLCPNPKKKAKITLFFRHVDTDSSLKNI